MSAPPTHQGAAVVKESQAAKADEPKQESKDEEKNIDSDWRSQKLSRKKSEIQRSRKKEPRSKILKLQPQWEEQPKEKTTKLDDSSEDEVTTDVIAKEHVQTVLKAKETRDNMKS